MKGKTIKNTFVLGFALFAMFFGAGNLIFPPFLGFTESGHWFLGFLLFIILDIGMSVAALAIIAYVGRKQYGIVDNMGKAIAMILLILNALCLGPMIAIPRTAATTLELSILPSFPDFNPVIFSVIFFVVVTLLSIRQLKVIDIIGSILAPLMFIALLVLITKGIVSPLGDVAEAGSASSAVKSGLLNGYQTMDMLGAIVFSSSVLITVSDKGYKTEKGQFRIILLSGIVCTVCLFIVYCGLCYLGATSVSIFPESIDRSTLLIDITRGLMGDGGIVLLGIIVFLACLTTAIGLTTSVASYFTDLARNKIGYPVWVIITAVVSCLVSTLGINEIISLASPVLELIYPIFIVLIVLSIFYGRLEGVADIFRITIAGVFVVSLLNVIELTTGADLLVSRLPFYDYGLFWFVPALVFFVISIICHKVRKK